MELSDFYSNLERDPDEQRYIVEEMTARLDQAPDDVHAYFRRGNALSNLHDYTQAQRDFDQVLVMQPTNAMAYNNRGITFLCTGDAAAALEDFCRALALDATYRDAYHNRGLAYAELERLDEALADLTQALTLDPNFWSAYRHRGIVQAMRGDHAASFQDYLKARALEEGA
jgi:tetratricopeptide (TPR) repeat protein